MNCLSHDKNRKNYALLSQEFIDKHGKLSVRLDRLQITQRSSIDKTIQEIYTLDSKYEPMDPFILNLIGAFYLYIKTEEIFLVTLHSFLSDMETYSKLKGFDIFHSTQDISEQEIITHVFEPFIASLDRASHAVSSLSQWLIVRYGTDWPENLIVSYAINDFLKPLLRELVKISPEVDTRFLAALAYYITEDFITRKRRINEGDLIVDTDVTGIYSLFQKQYPLNAGIDLAYDMAYNLIYKPLWPALLELIQEEVEKLQEKIKIDRETAEREQEREEERMKHQYSDEYYMSAIGMRLFEIFVQHQPLNQKKEDIIIKSFDVLARRLAIDKYGYISAKQEEIHNLVIDLIIGTCKDYPQVFKPLLGQHEIISLRNASIGGETAISKWVENNLPFLKERFRAYLTTSGSTNIQEVGKRFVNLIKRAKRSNIQI